MAGFVRKFTIEYVLRNSEGKELARIPLGKISQKDMNLIDEANYTFHDQITSDIIEFNEAKRTTKKEYEQLSLFSVCETKGIK